MPTCDTKGCCITGWRVAPAPQQPLHSWCLSWQAAVVVARVSKAAARPVTDALGPLHEALAMAPAAGKVTAMRAYNDSTERRQNQGSTQLNQLVSCMLLCGHCCCDISLSPKAQGRANLSVRARSA